jgi:excinuclease ABC subunit C
MQKNMLHDFDLPSTPGVYLFRDRRGKILYVGKATSLRDRVRSYFSTDMVFARGPLIVKMVEEARTVTYEETDSVLEALIREVALIKKYQPKYNTKEKSDKSFYYVIITNEEYPRVLLRRGRELVALGGSDDVRSVFGPFPRGGVLKDALKIVRKIFPYRDMCKTNSGKPCFNRQIGLCPGVCSGEISVREYRAHIKRLELFLGGKKTELIERLEKDMDRYARKEMFEEAGRIKRTLHNLKHIYDVALIKHDDEVGCDDTYRIEAYDVAHMAGAHTVGVMVVRAGRSAVKDEYRLFTIRNIVKGDDLAALEETLSRRLAHAEWTYPRLIVIDGGKNQLRRAQKVLADLGVEIPIVSVVKDDRHNVRKILGDRELVRMYERNIIAANTEAHRFAIGAFRRKQRKEFVA